MDPRIKELSALLTGYSCALKPGEKVLIDYEGECSKPLVRQLIKEPTSWVLVLMSTTATVSFCVKCC